MSNFRRGDKVKRRGDAYIATVVNIEERGVAGCQVTYIKSIEVAYPNGMRIKGDPKIFEKVEQDEVGSEES